MARKNYWFAALITVGIVFAIAIRPALADESAYNNKYYVGSGEPVGTSGKFIYFDNLEELRQGYDTGLSLVDKDVLRLFQNDDKLSEQLSLTVSGTVKIVSSGFSTRRTWDLAPLDLKPGETPGVRRFLTASMTPGSNLQIENMVFQNAYNEFDEAAKKSSRRQENGAGAIRLDFTEGYSTYNATLINTDFFDNKTDGSGGAIHVRGNSVNLTLKVVHMDGDETTTMTFRGNEHLDSIDWNDDDDDAEVPEEPTYYYTNNSIAFTNFWSTNFVVDTEDHTLLDMQDPFKQGRVDTGSAGAFLVVKQGLGTWRLGGVNQTGNTQSSVFQIREGALELTKNAAILMDGYNNSFRLYENATLALGGGNTIATNNIIRFDENSTLSFDLGFFDDGDIDPTAPMLTLIGDTIAIGYKEAGPTDEVDFLTSKVKIEIEGINYYGVDRDLEYLLIQGSTDIHMDLESVDLYIGGVQVDQTDILHERFGFSLQRGKDNDSDDLTQVILKVGDNDNTVLRWNGNGNEWNRDLENQNWNQIRNNQIDSFVSGDTAQFFASGTHIINLTQDIVVGHNVATDTDGEIWYDAVGDTTGMHVSGNGHWTFTGKSIRDNDNLGRASLLYDGSGSLTLANDTANAYSWNVLSGSGTLNVARADLLGTEAVIFAETATKDAVSKLHFTAATTLTSRLVAENGSNGLVTVGNGYGVNLTITRVADKSENAGGAVYVQDGGKLHIKADPVTNELGQTYGRIIFEGNGGKADVTDPELYRGGAALVDEGGELVLDNVEFRSNSAWNNGGAIETWGTVAIQNGTFVGNTSLGSETVPDKGFGGAISISGATGTSMTTITDSTFTGNRAANMGGAIAAGVANGEKLQLTIAASEGGTTLFSGNTGQSVYEAGSGTWTGVANSLYFDGTGAGVINLTVDTAKNGTVDMRDAMLAKNAYYSINVTKSGAGTWKLAGNNVFEAQRGTIFKIAQGSLDLYRADNAKAIEAGSINIAGSLEIADGGALVSRGGNTVTVEQFKLANGAILGFDLDQQADVNYPYSDPLLVLKANAYDFSSGWQKIDIVGLSTVETNGYGTFNLAEFVGHTLTAEHVEKLNRELLFHGESISAFRQTLGKLQIDETGSILQVFIQETDNGVTQWTNKDGNSIWNGESSNWKGTNLGHTDITNTEQFLHGDAVIFGNTGSGRIEVIAGGVEIADQGTQPGMTVYNFDETDANNATINNDYTFHGGSITGNARLLKQGSGSLTFEQENMFLGGVTVEGGTVVAKKVNSLRTWDSALDPTDSGAIDAIAALDLVDHAAVVEFDVAESGTYYAKVTGKGAFVKSGIGTLWLAGDNSYSGGTTILGGGLVAEQITSFGTGPLVTGEGEQSGVAVFDLNTGIKDDVKTFTQVISGTGSVRNIGTTTLILTAKNKYSGGTANDFGATLIGTNVNAFGSGNLINQGTVVFDLADGNSGTFAQNISGSGGLVKNGTAKLTLAGNNTYTGDTVIRGGELYLDSENAAAASIVRINGGILSFAGLDRFKIGGLDGATKDTEILLSSLKGDVVTLTIDQSNTELTAKEIPNFLGKFTGGGVIIKDGAGTQIFSGESTYSGGTLIRNGRLVAGLTGLGTGDVINNAELELTNTGTGTFQNRIVGSGSLYKTGTGTLELTGVNTYSGGTFIENGHLVAHSFDTVGTGGIAIRNAKSSFTINLAEDAELDREISGAGDFYKSGLGNLFIEGTLALQGRTHITGGTLYLNGTSSSNTIVYSGGTLSGTGVLNNEVVFQQGASHRVGHSTYSTLSTFTAKNITYENGSRIYVKVGKNGSDRIVAKEAIDFARGGGAVEVVLINLGLDDFDDTSTFAKEYEVFVSENNHILLDGTSITNHESDGSVLTVDGVDASVSFRGGDGEGLGVIGYSVTTNADSTKSISLNVAVSDPGAVAYLDENQRAVLKGLDDTDVFDRIYSVSKDKRGDVVNYLMPQIQTLMPFLNQRVVTQFNEATNERLRFLREPFTLNVATYSDDDNRGYRGASQRLAHLRGPACHSWFQNYGDFMKLSGNGSVSEFSANSYGFNLGYDHGISPCSVVGIGFGGYFSEVKANDVHQEGEANSMLLSIYGSRSWNDGWTLAGSLGFVFSRYELDRHADFFKTTMHSKHDGLSFFGSFEGSKKFRFDYFEVTPYFGMDFIWLGEDGYTEKAKGDHDLALKIRYSSTFTCLSSMGVRFGRAYRMLGGNILHPTLYAAWVHDWSHSDIASKASFTGMPAFKIRGASMNRDRAQLGVNANMTLNPRMDLFTRFNAEMARRYSDISVHLGFRLGY